MEDLIAERSATSTPDGLRFIHQNKTAAMIEAALAMGGICGGAPDCLVEALRAAGGQLGLAFQIVDDILDATSDTATLGKTAGKDAKAGKATYVSVHGLDAARRIARERSESADRHPQAPARRHRVSGSPGRGPREAHTLIVAGSADCGFRWGAPFPRCPDSSPAPPRRWPSRARHSPLRR